MSAKGRHLCNSSAYSDIKRGGRPYIRLPETKHPSFTYQILLQYRLQTSQIANTVINVQMFRDVLKDYRNDAARNNKDQYFQLQ